MPLFVCIEVDQFIRSVILLSHTAVIQSRVEIMLLPLIKVASCFIAISQKARLTLHPIRQWIVYSACLCVIANACMQTKPGDSMDAMTRKVTDLQKAILTGKAIREFRDLKIVNVSGTHDEVWPNPASKTPATMSIC
jgi:hypothetical protein